MPGIRFGDTRVGGSRESTPSSGVSYAGNRIGASPPSVFERTAGALFVGANKDPLVGFALDQIADYTGMWEREDVEKLANRLTNSNLADLFEIIGEWGPMLATGAGLYTAGKAVATGGLRLAAKGATTGQLGKVATRASDFAGNLGLGGTARIAKPGIERAAEIAGGSLGIGTLSGAEEAASGGDFGEVLKSFGIGTALTVGLEGTLAGIGKAVRSAHQANLESIKAVRRTGRPERKAVDRELKGQVVGMRKALDKVLKVEQQELELLGTAVAPTASSLKTMAREVKGEFRRPIDEAMMPLRAAKAARGQQQRKVRGFMDVTDYTRDVPFNPSGKREAIATFMAKILKTPEGLGRELGPTAMRLVKDAGEAESEIALLRVNTMVHAAKRRQQVSKILGHRKFKSALKDPRFKTLFKEWEQGSDEAAEAYLLSIGKQGMIGTAREMFEGIRDLRRTYEQLVKLGAEPSLSAADLQALGVKEWLPHVLNYANEDDFLKQAAKALGGGEKGKIAAQRMLDRATKDGLSKFGSIDHQRMQVGSLADKLAQGMPLVDDPIEAIALYEDQVVRRIAYGKRFGFSGELKDSIIRQATAEGASSPLIHTVADTLLAHKYYPAATRRLFRNITDLETATKLTLAVIPNMSQTINTILFNGYRNTARGMIKAVSPGLQRQQFAQATGIAQGSYDMMRHLFQESGLKGSQIDKLFERAARGTLKWSGFEAIENFNRFVGGTSGAYTIRRDLSRAVAGRLRGNNLDQARRRMRSLGINLDEKVLVARKEAARLGVKPEEIDVSALFRPTKMAPNGSIIEIGEFDRAIFNAAKQTQFTPDATRLPAWWQTPAGRVVFQFKRFALSQGRFLRDQVLAEASHGNMKPLASFLAIYPIAGEAVGSARYAIRGKDRPDDHVYRFMTNLGYVGGFGLAWDTLASAKWGRLGSALMGPAAGDMVEVAETIAQGQSIGRFFARQPVTQAAKAIALGSAATIGGILEYVDQEGARSPLSDEAVSIEDLVKESKK